MSDDEKKETRPLLKDTKVSSCPTYTLSLSEEVLCCENAGDNDSSDADLHPGVSNMRRTHRHATSNTATMIHLLKSNIGTGIQSMPYAFKNSGMIFGSAGIFAMGLLCLHGMNIVVNASQALCDRLKLTSLDLAEVMYNAFLLGPQKLRRFAGTSRRVVNAFLCWSQFSLCCVYYVFVAKNLETFMKDQLQFSMPVLTYMAALIIPFFLLASVKSLKFLAPISMLANVVQCVAIGITFYFLLRELKPVETRHYVAPVADWPLFLGIAVFSFESVGIVLPLENAMKTPRDFVGYTGVLNTGMIIVISLYVAVGFFGYLEYGDDVRGSVTLNLPAGDPSAAAVQLMMILAVFFSYALQLYVPLEVIWAAVMERLPNLKHVVPLNYLLRLIFVILTFGCSSLVPNIEIIIALTGALCSSFLSFVFPGVVDCVMFWDEIGWLRLCKDLGLIGLGLFSFALGTYTTMARIVDGETTT